MENQTKTLIQNLEKRRQQMLITKILDERACRVCWTEQFYLINGTCVHCYNKQFERGKHESIFTSR